MSRLTIRPGTIAPVAAAALIMAGSLALPAEATASRTPQCGNADLAVSYRHPTGGEGMNQVWGWIMVRNRSHHRCATGGFPGVSYVGHGNGTQIGAAATRTGTSRWFVLEPGQSLRSSIDETNAGVYDRARCHPRHVDGFRVYVPDARVSQYVVHPRTGCANPAVHLLSLRGFRR